MTVRHIVLTKFKPSITAPERQSIFDELAALRGHLSGIQAMAFGANVSPEGLGLGFAHGFTIDFADAAARDAYLVDDAHGRAGGRLVSMLEGGLEGLIVFDLEMTA
ncbi:MAG: Dabb family protein [Ramlibacter sp.]